MSWLDQIRARVFRPGESLKQADRRAFLLGATVTAAGLLLPKAIVSVPKWLPGERQDQWSLVFLDELGRVNCLAIDQFFLAS